MEFLSGRAAAAGIAAMNSITMFSGFVGPYWMEHTNDLTGNYRMGLLGLVLPSLAAAGILHLLARNLARSRAVVPVAAGLAEESV
jgi:ACS family tartrate transporter-like MFS transporter